MASTKNTPKMVAKSFDAILERASRLPHWVVIRVPLDVVKVWGVRGHLRVKGEINGFAFASALFPTREGCHFMVINKRMQTGAKATAGAKARFRVEPDVSSRKVAAPAELLRELRQSKRLQKYHDALSPAMRNDIARWVSEGKQNETRQRRAQQLAERLMLTMEAERELPPILQAALHRNPRARAGWERMSPACRRNHLLSIFYYRDPESRARRVAKAVEAMVERAEKRSSAN
jgi:uncharacterized protein YdeI (YjbR/CyaY-like superfamily)